MKKTGVLFSLLLLCNVMCGATMPSTVSDPNAVGMRIDLESRLDSMVAENIKAGAYPGCQIVVMKNGHVVLDKAYGHHTYDTVSPAVDRNTLYDIASMTKATATLGGLMAAYDRGLYNLDSVASKYLPRLRGTDKEDITVRQLLYHESGLPATINTYQLMVDTASYSGRLIKYKCVEPYTVRIEKGVYGNSETRLRSDILSDHRSDEFRLPVAKHIWGGEDMVNLVDSAIYNSHLGKRRYLYSCLNFCILADMEEQLTGQSHQRWVERQILEPLQMSRTCFKPLERFGTGEIAPTEKDGFLRRQLIHGYVHDEIAAYSGGVQGNAGLFSTAEDIARWGQMLLNGGQWHGRRVLKESTVREFLKSESQSSRRGLGFDKAYRMKSYDKMGIGKSVVGHTGFTGTCFWVDPENELVVVFLCNRVYPSRDNTAYNEQAPRTELMRIVYESLNDRINP